MRRICAILLFAAALFTLQCGSRGDGPGKMEKTGKNVLPTVPAFDERRAFEYLTTQTSFGPRVPGSPGHHNCLAYLQNELSRYADTLLAQEFTTSVGRLGLMRLTNLVARFRPGETNRILLSAHWDSRPWADEDRDAANRIRPTLGANDGASGVAILLEMARCMKAESPPLGVDIVLFDGEDAGTPGDLTTWCLGSKYFAKNLPGGPIARCAINLDMVGDRNLTIPREQRSDRYHHKLLNLIFATSSELAIAAFVDRQGDDVYDDHVPLSEAGIPAVDLIDFNYPDETNSYWHTTQDTQDKCSSTSLGAVGELLVHLLYVKADHI